MSSFFGINISRLGMQAQQKALEVTSHNIANANTEGYSRQVTRMTTTTPIPYSEGKGMLGTGVVAAEISRVRDSFLDMQIRNEIHAQSRWDTSAQILSKVELVFMEPSETGFNNLLNVFFDSWQELSLNPESTPVRTVVTENAGTLVNSAKHINEQLKTLRTDIDDTIRLSVMEVNTLAEQIKDLNGQIVKVVALGEMPGDLLDRRDLLVDQLAHQVDFEAMEAANGALYITIGGRTLVGEKTANKMAVVPSDGMVDGWLTAPQIVWEKDGHQVAVSNGAIGGLQDIRDGSLKEYMESFESLVWGIVNAVNHLHGEGMDLYGQPGAEFFTGDYLENLAVNPAIKEDGGKIAAALPAATANEGDGGNALKIAQLQDFKMIFDQGADLNSRFDFPGDGEQGTTTFEGYYQDTIARLGVDAQESNRMTENQNALVDMMKARRTSISGVSLDEELANMVQFQLAYQASARLITTFDEILDTVINQMAR